MRHHSLVKEEHYKHAVIRQGMFCSSNLIIKHHSVGFNFLNVKQHVKGQTDYTGFLLCIYLELTNI